jgi:hypothetical protein
MLSTRLLHRIEDHADQLASAIVSRFQANENLASYHNLSESELHEQVSTICKHLGEWLTEETEAPLQERYEALGERRFRKSIPLHETVLALQLTKNRILAFAGSGGFSETALELYGREELELRVSHFFDRATYYLVRGYERALHREKQAH